MNGLLPRLRNVTLATAVSRHEEKNVVTLAAAGWTHKDFVARGGVADGRRYLCA